MKSAKPLLAVTCLLDLLFVFVFVTLLSGHANNKYKQQVEVLNTERQRLEQALASSKESEAALQDIQLVNEGKIDELSLTLKSKQASLAKVERALAEKLALVKQGDNEKQLLARRNEELEQQVVTMREQVDKSQHLANSEVFNQSSKLDIHNINGAYDGIYNCTQGKTIIKLHLWRNEGNRVYANYNFKFGKIEGSYLMTGTYATDGQLDLTPVKWITHPEGWRMIKLSGTLKQGVYKGTSESCPDGKNRFYVVKKEDYSDEGVAELNYLVGQILD